jgi:hypothetical protein
MEVKGTAVIPIRDYVLSKFSSRYQEWLDSLSPASQNIMRNPLSSIWYPLQPSLVEPTQRICDVFHNGNEQGAWQVGRFSAEHALKGIYSMFVKLGSPGFIVSRGSRIISQYYRPCEMKVTENQSGCAVMQIVHFPESNRLIEMRIGGWMEKAIELSGNKPTTNITRSMAGGDSVTEYHTVWK